MTMDLPVLPRTVHSGKHQLTFNAAVLAAATSRRPGHPRWTELTVYRQPKYTEEPPTGGYVVSKIGRSQVMHSDTCHKARPTRMAQWTPERAAGEWLVPCLDCNPQPTLNGAPVWVEQDRHEVLQARNPKDLALIILTKGMVASAMRGMTSEIVYQLRQADPDFDRLWVDEIEPNLMEDD